ncbi:hypothetical protein ABW20_dc0107663 [Dactylellina cionopaga]|nr:hypothetical protein ABW20_dc0107663 [Dactylellina cionopaga]
MKLLEIQDIDKAGDVFLAYYRHVDEEHSNQYGHLGILRGSLKALALASPVLDAMLNPSHGFKESHIDELSGMKEVRWMTEDLEVATIVMNIIHDQNSSIPKSLTLSQLYDMATLWDCYQFDESLIVALNGWTKTLWDDFSHNGRSSIADVDEIQDLRMR